ncbi:MAG: SPASM domain-containing protein [Tenericutes bacterium]|nr:SPASM domain-containing protein [Mycoplasmatota bacterium]
MDIDNLMKIELSDCIIIVNTENGDVIEVDKRLFNDKKALNKELIKNNFYEKLLYSMKFSKDSFKTVYISLHISSKCNMNCKYCFMNDRKYNNLSFEDSKKFIDMIIDEYPNAGKYIVDPTGSGEPLLELDNLCKIGEYCKQKSDDLKREVLPMIVTNGLLLTEKVVKRLRESGVLFGVSLDGDKKTNDIYRYDYLGNGTYKRVISNVKKIKDRSLMGVALTITDKNMDLVKNLKHLIKYFPTVSMKPVRVIDSNIGINESNIDKLKNSYTELYEFLLKQTTKGNLEYLSAILNGDDYFGKFLLRSILCIKVTTRCDAGVGRFSLAPDGLIYACPGAIDISELVIGSLEKGIEKEKRDFLWNTLVNRNKCQDCYAKFVCGGECFVNAYYSTKSITEKDDVMCELKRHLFKLSLAFNHYLKQMECYSVVIRGCVEKTKRFDEEKEVTNFLKRNPNVSFNDIKYHKAYIDRK